MKKKIAFISIVVGLILSARIMTTYAAGGEKMIQTLGSDQITQEEQYVSINVSVADSVELPLKVQMKSGIGLVTLDIQENGNTFLVVPTTYTITSAVSGNGKKYEAGATLKIADNGGLVYLDFTKPKNAEENEMPTWSKVIVVNVLFILFAAGAFKLFTWYRDHLT